MRSKLDAGISVAECLLRFGVDDAARRLLDQSTPACSLPSRKSSRRFLKQRVIKSVMRVRVFCDLNVLACFAESLDIATAWPHRHIVVGRSVEQTYGRFAHHFVFDVAGVTGCIERNGIEELLHVVADPNDQRVPEITRACVAALGAQLHSLREQILAFDRMIMAWHRSSATSKRLDEIPGVGPALATALVASIADPKAFRSGRDFSAWIGLVPKQHSSGGKEKLGSISKQGDRYLRSLFTTGALAVIRYAKIYGTKHRPWLTALLARRPTKVAAIAL